MRFDTLAYVDALTKSGVDRKQAKAQALRQIVMDDQATKRDLERLADTLTIRFGGMLVIAIGVVATLIKVL